MSQFLNGQHDSQVREDQTNTRKSSSGDQSSVNGEINKQVYQFQEEGQVLEKKSENNSRKNSDEGIKISTKLKASSKNASIQQSENPQQQQSSQINQNQTQEKSDSSPQQHDFQQMAGSVINQQKELNSSAKNKGQLQNVLQQQQQNRQVDSQNNLKQEKDVQDTGNLNKGDRNRDSNKQNSNQQTNKQQQSKQVNENNKLGSSQNNDEDPILLSDSSDNAPPKQLPSENNQQQNYTRNRYGNEPDEVQESESVKKSKKQNIRSNEGNGLKSQIGNGKGDFAQELSLEIYKMVDKISEDLEKQKETNQYLFEEMKELQNMNSQRSGERTSRLSSFVSENQSPQEIKSMDFPRRQDNNQDFNTLIQQKQQNQQQNTVSSQPHSSQVQQENQQQPQNFQAKENQKKVKSAVPSNQAQYNQNQQQSGYTNNDQMMTGTFSQNPQASNQFYPQSNNNSMQEQQRQMMGVGMTQNNNPNNEGYSNLMNSNISTQSQQFENQPRINQQHQDQQLNQPFDQNNQNNAYNFYNNNNNNNLPQDVEKMIQKILFLQKENDTLNKENELLREKNNYYAERLKQIEDDSRNQVLNYSQNNSNLNPNNMYNFSSASSRNGSAIQLNVANGSYNQFATPLSNTNKKNTLSTPHDNNYFLSSSNQKSNLNDNSIGSSQSLDTTNTLKKLCEVMCADSVEQLIPAAKKYGKCIQSIPKLESFIMKVYNIVFPDITPNKKNFSHLQDLISEISNWRDERHGKLGQSNQQFASGYSSMKKVSPNLNNSSSTANFREYQNFYQSFIQVFQCDEQKEDILKKLYFIRNQNQEHQKFIKQVKKTLELDPQIRDDLVLKITFDKLAQYPIYRQFTKSLQKKSGITDLNKLYSQLEMMIAMMQQNKNNSSTKMA